MSVKDLIKLPDLIALAEVARITLDEVNGRRAVVNTKLLTLNEVQSLRAEIAKFLDTINTMDPVALAHEIETETRGGFTINLNKHLNPLAFLITIEVARMLLGDKTRRDWVLDKIDLDDEEADEVYRRLSRLMAEIRSNERHVTSPENIPAVDSRINENP